jgi:hypothetical protein
MKAASTIIDQKQSKRARNGIIPNKEGQSRQQSYKNCLLEANENHTGFTG